MCVFTNFFHYTTFFFKNLVELKDQSNTYTNYTSTCVHNIKAFPFEGTNYMYTCTMHMYMYMYMYNACTACTYTEIYM